MQSWKKMQLVGDTLHAVITVADLVDPRGPGTRSVLSSLYQEEPNNCNNWLGAAELKKPMTRHTLGR